MKVLGRMSHGERRLVNSFYSDLQCIQEGEKNPILQEIESYKYMVGISFTVPMVYSVCIHCKTSITSAYSPQGKGVNIATKDNFVKEEIVVSVTTDHAI